MRGNLSRYWFLTHVGCCVGISVGSIVGNGLGTWNSSVVQVLFSIQFVICHKRKSGNLLAAALTGVG